MHPAPPFTKVCFSSLFSSLLHFYPLLPPQKNPSLLCSWLLNLIHTLSPLNRPSAEGLTTHSVFKQARKHQAIILRTLPKDTVPVVDLDAEEALAGLVVPEPELPGGFSRLPLAALRAGSLGIYRPPHRSRVMAPHGLTRLVSEDEDLVAMRANDAEADLDMDMADAEEHTVPQRSQHSQPEPDSPWLLPAAAAAAAADAAALSSADKAHASHHLPEGDSFLPGRAYSVDPQHVPVAGPLSGGSRTAEHRGDYTGDAMSSTEGPQTGPAPAPAPARRAKRGSLQRSDASSEDDENVSRALYRQASSDGETRRTPTAHSYGDAGAATDDQQTPGWERFPTFDHLQPGKSSRAESGANQPAAGTQRSPPSTNRGALSDRAAFDELAGLYMNRVRSNSFGGRTQNSEAVKATAGPNSGQSPVAVQRRPNAEPHRALAGPSRSLDADQPQREQFQQQRTQAPASAASHPDYQRRQLLPADPVQTSLPPQPFTGASVPKMDLNIKVKSSVSGAAVIRPQSAGSLSPPLAQSGLGGRPPSQSPLQSPAPLRTSPLQRTSPPSRLAMRGRAASTGSPAHSVGEVSSDPESSHATSAQRWQQSSHMPPPISVTPAYSNGPLFATSALGGGSGSSAGSARMRGSYSRSLSPLTRGLPLEALPPVMERLEGTAEEASPPGTVADLSSRSNADEIRWRRQRQLMSRASIGSEDSVAEASTDRDSRRQKYYFPRSSMGVTGNSGFHTSTPFVGNDPHGAGRSGSSDPRPSHNTIAHHRSGLGTSSNPGFIEGRYREQPSSSLPAERSADGELSNERGAGAAAHHALRSDPQMGSRQSSSGSAGLAILNHRSTSQSPRSQRPMFPLSRGFRGSDYSFHSGIEGDDEASDIGNLSDMEEVHGDPWHTRRHGALGLGKHASNAGADLTPVSGTGRRIGGEAEGLWRSTQSSGVEDPLLSSQMMASVFSADSADGEAGIPAGQGASAIVQDATSSANAKGRMPTSPLRSSDRPFFVGLEAEAETAEGGPTAESSGQAVTLQAASALPASSVPSAAALRSRPILRMHSVEDGQNHEPALQRHQGKYHSIHGEHPATHLRPPGPKGQPSPELLPRRSHDYPASAPEDQDTEQSTLRRQPGMRRHESATGSAGAGSSTMTGSIFETTSRSSPGRRNMHRRRSSDIGMPFFAQFSRYPVAGSRDRSGESGGRSSGAGSSITTGYLAGRQVGHTRRRSLDPTKLGFAPSPPPTTRGNSMRSSSHSPTRRTLPPNLAAGAVGSNQPRDPTSYLPSQNGEPPLSPLTTLRVSPQVASHQHQRRLHSHRLSSSSGGGADDPYGMAQLLHSRSPSATRRAIYVADTDYGTAVAHRPNSTESTPATGIMHEERLSRSGGSGRRRHAASWNAVDYVPSHREEPEDDGEEVDKLRRQQQQQLQEQQQQEQQDQEQRQQQQQRQLLREKQGEGDDEEAASSGDDAGSVIIKADSDLEQGRPSSPETERGHSEAVRTVERMGLTQWRNGTASHSPSVARSGVSIDVQGTNQPVVASAAAGRRSMSLDSRTASSAQQMCQRLISRHRQRSQEVLTESSQPQDLDEGHEAYHEEWQDPRIHTTTYEGSGGSARARREPAMLTTIRSVAPRPGVGEQGSFMSNTSGRSTPVSVASREGTTALQPPAKAHVSLSPPQHRRAFRSVGSATAQRPMLTRFASGGALRGGSGRSPAEVAQEQLRSVSAQVADSETGTDVTTNSDVHPPAAQDSGGSEAKSSTGVLPPNDQQSGGAGNEAAAAEARRRHVRETIC